MHTHSIQLGADGNQYGSCLSRMMEAKIGWLFRGTQEAVAEMRAARLNSLPG